MAAHPTGVSTTTYSLASSANLLNVHSTPLSTSLIKILKSTGPSTDSCGTLLVTDLHPEMETLTTTLWTQSCSSFVYWTVHPSNPSLSSLERMLLGYCVKSFTLNCYKDTTKCYLCMFHIHNILSPQQGKGTQMWQKKNFPFLSTKIMLLKVNIYMSFLPTSVVIGEKITPSYFSDFLHFGDLAGFLLMTSCADTTFIFYPLNSRVARCSFPHAVPFLSNADCFSSICFSLHYFSCCFCMAVLGTLFRLAYNLHYWFHSHADL